MNKEIEYLKEHLYEIYKYKKSMKDLTYDMDLEHLLRTCKALDYLQQELERYKNIVDEAIEYINLVATDHDIMNNNEIIYTQMQYEQIENVLEILKGE